VPVTESEFNLLWLLASNEGQTVSRDQILKSTRSIDYDGMDRSVDAKIRRIRAKLTPINPKLNIILTVRAKGYRFIDLPG